MRIGLLGPVGDHVDSLEAVATFCIAAQGVDTLYYLGDDNPLVLLPKEAPNPHAEAEFWGHAQRLVSASAAELVAFVAHARIQHAAQSVVLFGEELVRRISSPLGHRWVLCHSSRHLTSDDQVRGHVLAYGNSPEWLIQRAGEQILVAPGPFETAGLLVLDDSDGLNVELFSRKCESLLKRRLDFSPTLHPPPSEGATAH